MFKLFSKAFSLFFNDSEKDLQQIQIFTYFIPAPPTRKSGYREKEIDAVFEQLNSIGFDILDIKTQALSNQEQSGMWVIAKLSPKTKEAKELKVSQFPKEFEGKDTDIIDEKTLHNEKSIDLPENQEGFDGIYYID